MGVNVKSGRWQRPKELAMASAQVDASPQHFEQQPLSPVSGTGELGEEETQTLNTILRPHLRLETAEQPVRPAKGLRDLGASFSKPGAKQAENEKNQEKVELSIKGITLVIDTLTNSNIYA